MEKELKPEIRVLWDKMNGINADEKFVEEEFNRRNLRKEVHRNDYKISYNILGHCFISDMLSTMSSTAEIAVMKQLIKFDIVGNDENYIS